MRHHAPCGTGQPIGLSKRVNSKRPEFLDWNQDEKNAFAVETLKNAFCLISNNGWAPLMSLEELRNGPRPPGLSIREAIGASAKHETGIDTYWAEALVRKIEWDFHAFERAPFVRMVDVLRLIQRAILVAGGEPPALPKYRNEAPRRGGWRIAS